MKKTLLNILILLLFISNNTGVFLFVITVLFFSICFLYGTASISPVKFLVTAALFICISLNFLHLETKTCLRMIQLLIGFLFFPLKISVKDVSINVLRFCIAYIFFFFVCNMFNITPVQEIILKLYPTEGNSWLILYDGTRNYAETLSGILKQRIASIYYNPNILAQSMLLAFALYLLYYFKKKIVAIDYIFILLLILMMIGGGSRTAFIPFLIMLVLYIKKFNSKKVFWGVVIPALAYGMYYLFFNTRLLLVFFVAGIGDQGMDSMGEKNQILKSYLENYTFQDTLGYIFGQLAFDQRFDYDIGDIMYNFGILGLVAIVLFMANEVIAGHKRVRYFYSFLLLSYGATLIINFKFFIFTILILSLMRELNASLAGEPRKGETGVTREKLPLLQVNSL